MYENLTHKLLSKGFWFTFFGYLVVPAGYLTRIIIARDVSIAELGVLYALIGLLGLLNTYNDLGCSEALNYFIPRFYAQKNYNALTTVVIVSFVAQVGTGILLSLGLWLLSDWLAIHYFRTLVIADIVPYFCFYFILVNILQAVYALHSAFQDEKGGIITLAQTWSIFFLAVGVFFLDGGLMGYSLAWFIGTGIGAGVAIIRFFRKYRGLLLRGRFIWDKTILFPYWKYALFVFLGINAGVLFGQIDNLVIMGWPSLGSVAAGYYTNYTSLLGIRAVILGPLYGLLFPVVSDLVAREEKEKLTYLVSIIMTYVPLVGLFLGMYFVVLGPEIASYFFGVKYVMGKFNTGMLLQWTGWVSMLLVIFELTFQILAGLGEVKLRVFAIWKALLLHILVLFPLLILTNLGIWAMVISTFVSRFSMLLVGVKKLRQCLVFHINWHLRVKNTFIAVVVGLIIWKLKSYWFVFDDLHKVHNTIVLALIGFGSLGLIALANMKAIRQVWQVLKPFVVKKGNS